LNKLSFQFELSIYTLLSFLDNAHDLFLKGTMAENHCKMTCGSGSVDEVKSSFPHKKIGKNRNAKNGIIKGVEPNSTPNNKKYSSKSARIELFVQTCIPLLSILLWISSINCKDLKNVHEHLAKKFL
jgi:hypothetical protein